MKDLYKKPLAKRTKNHLKEIASVRKDIENALFSFDNAYRTINMLNSVLFEDRLRIAGLIKTNIDVVLRQMVDFSQMLEDRDFLINLSDWTEFKYSKDVLAQLEIDRERKLKEYRVETDAEKKFSIKRDLIDIEIELESLRKKILNEKV